MRIAKRYDSTDVQGEGSYVVMWRRTYGQSKEMRAAANRQGELLEAQIKAKKAGKAAPKGEEPEDDGAMTERFIIAAIEEWNWTDTDGKPLPLPQNDPTVLDAMPEDEIAFLMRVWFGQVDVKN